MNLCSICLAGKDLLKLDDVCLLCDVCWCYWYAYGWFLGIFVHAGFYMMMLFTVVQNPKPCQEILMKCVVCCWCYDVTWVHVPCHFVSCSKPSRWCLLLCCNCNFVQEIPLVVFGLLIFWLLHNDVPLAILFMCFCLQKPSSVQVSMIYVFVFVGWDCMLNFLLCGCVGLVESCFVCCDDEQWPCCFNPVHEP